MALLKSKTGKLCEVNVYPVFKLYGRKFVAHNKLIKLSRGKYKTKRGVWVVSDYLTGLLVSASIQAKTRQTAAALTKEFLLTMGEDALKKAVSRRKEINNGG